MLSSIPNITSVTIPSTVAFVNIRNCPDVKKYYVDENNENYCSQDGVIELSTHFSTEII